MGQLCSTEKDHDHETRSNLKSFSIENKDKN